MAAAAVKSVAAVADKVTTERKGTVPPAIQTAIDIGELQHIQGNRLHPLDLYMKRTIDFKTKYVPDAQVLAYSLKAAGIASQGEGVVLHKVVNLMAGKGDQNGLVGQHQQLGHQYNLMAVNHDSEAGTVEIRIDDFTFLPFHVTVPAISLVAVKSLTKDQLLTIKCSGAPQCALAIAPSSIVAEIGGNGIVMIRDRVNPWFWFQTSIAKYL